MSIIKKQKILAAAMLFAFLAAPCIHAQVSVSGTWYSESSTGSGVNNTSSGSTVSLQNTTGGGARIGAVVGLNQTITLNAVGDYIEVSGNYSGAVSNNVNYSIRIGFYDATGLTINQHYDSDMDSLVGNFAGLATRWNNGAHSGIFNQSSNGNQVLALNQATPPNMLGSSVTTATTGDRTITYRVERTAGDNLQFTLNDGGNINITRTLAVASASTIKFNTLAVGFFLTSNAAASISNISITSSSGGGAVNQAPIVDAGSNQTIALPASANLDGTVSDDGLPGSGLTTLWSKVSGPGTVSFGNAGAVDTTASFSTTGSYVLRLTADDGALSTSDDVSIAVNAQPPPSGQSPYGGTAWAIPGRIEAENYDLGGSGVAFSDTTSGNSGGVFRSDSVDIQATSDTGGGHNVGWIANGEWLEYTVNVAQAGSYDITARVASQSAGGSLRIDLNGVDVSGTMSFSATGGWQNWINVTAQGVSLNAGTQVMRITMQSANFNINYVDFALGGAATNQAPVVSAGNPQTITVSSSAFINATVTDDGLPNGSLSYQWSKQSGPGTVTFVSPTSEDTAVSFSATGTYVLRLSVSDGALSSSDTVTITVNQGPPPLDTIPHNFSQWTERGTVLSHGTGWESHGKVFVQNILKVNGTYYLYYLGNDATGLHNAGANAVSLGLATSTDGVNFTRHPNNPLITAQQAVYVDSWEHGLRNVSVVKTENGWFLWASIQGDFNRAPGAAPKSQWRGDIEVDTKVFGFSSTNGVNWTLVGQTQGANNANGAENNPSSAEYYNGTYYLWTNRAEGGHKHYASKGTSPNSLSTVGWIDALNFGWSHVETFLHNDGNTVTLIYTPYIHPGTPNQHTNPGKTHFATTTLSNMTSVSNKRIYSDSPNVEYRHAILKDANEWKWYYSQGNNNNDHAVIKLRTAPLQ